MKPKHAILFIKGALFLIKSNKKDNNTMFKFSNPSILAFKFCT